MSAAAETLPLDENNRYFIIKFMNTIIDPPTHFYAKKWIFYVQALVFGGLATFCLIFGPLFLNGRLKKVNGNPGTDAGIALTIMSVPMMLVFTLALYNIRARRRPALRICREGVEILEIGRSSLDSIPMIPGWIRVAWLILSTQGFRRRIIHVPWCEIQDVRMTGPPMARQLIILTPGSIGTTGDPENESIDVDQIVLPEVMFTTKLDEIADAIGSNLDGISDPAHLASWDDLDLAHE